MPTNDNDIVEPRSLSLKQALRSDPAWDRLATQLAEQSCVLVRQLTEIEDIRIYVDRAARDHEMAQAFRALVLTRIAQRGFGIAAAPEGVARISYQVEALPAGGARTASATGTVGAADAGVRYRINVSARLNKHMLIASVYPDDALSASNLLRLR